MDDAFLKAQHTVVRLLALRDHSPLELSKKLKLRFEPDIAEKALLWALEKELVPSEEEDLMALSSRMGEALHRRKKGHLSVNAKLKQLGLPTLPEDRDLEMEKARLLLMRKYQVDVLKTREGAARASRFLQSRGFSATISRDILKELKGISE